MNKNIYSISFLLMFISFSQIFSEGFQLAISKEKREENGFQYLGKYYNTMSFFESPFLFSYNCLTSFFRRRPQNQPVVPRYDNKKSMPNAKVRSKVKTDPLMPSFEQAKNLRRGGTSDIVGLKDFLCEKNAQRSVDMSDDIFDNMSKNTHELIAKNCKSTPRWERVYSLVNDDRLKDADLHSIVAEFIKETQPKCNCFERSALWNYVNEHNVDREYKVRREALRYRDYWPHINCVPYDFIQKLAIFSTAMQNRNLFFTIEDIEIIDILFRSMTKFILKSMIEVFDEEKILEIEQNNLNVVKFMVNMCSPLVQRDFLFRGLANFNFALYTREENMYGTTMFVGGDFENQDQLEKAKNLCQQYETLSGIFESEDYDFVLVKKCFAESKAKSARK